MLTVAEDVIIAGFGNRPPMLDKTQYSSWASRMPPYIKDVEKIREECDIKATNIVLQDLPQDIYNLPFYSPLAQQKLNDVPMVQQRSYHAPVAYHSSVVDHQSYQAPAIHHLQASFPYMDLRLVVPSFLPTNDPIASLNEAMAFINTSFTSRYPPTSNQLRTSTN
nr:hypothetical protein [Tanacetum cinerariifolium]